MQLASQLPLAACSYCNSSLWIDLSVVLLHTTLAASLKEPEARRLAGLRAHEGQARLVHHPFWFFTRGVEARMAPGRDSVDALRAVFPAGTLSGAPKVRAMQLIASAKSKRRGLYGGAVGYLGYDGNLDTAITIRSAVLRDGQAHVHTGAGIVAGSVPEREFEETEHKAAALRRAIELAAEDAGGSTTNGDRPVAALEEAGAGVGGSLP